MPSQRITTVLENKRLTDTVWALTIEAAGLADSALPGQFVHILCGDKFVLRRPISVCGAGDGLLTVVAEARGEGTSWLAGRRAGDRLDVLGPLGRGFDLSGKNTILVGGGIGAPPLLFAARAFSGRVTAVLGFRTGNDVILENDFTRACAEVYITTDDGSSGDHGTVLLPLDRLLRSGGYDGVLACGPTAMLRAVAALCRTYAAPCQVSLEERMGCGVGACLVCACKTREDGKEQMRRVCRDGPVFNAREVVW